MSSHKDQTTSMGIHNPFNWVFLNESARTAYTSVVSSDIGKLAYQQDGYCCFMLTSVSPITWTPPNRKQDTVLFSDGYESAILNTSTSSYLTVLSSTFSVPATALTEIAYSFETNSQVSGATEVQININLDSVSIASFSTVFMAADYQSNTFFYLITLQAGSHTLDFQFKRPTAGGALARRVRLLVINRG